MTSPRWQRIRGDAQADMTAARERAGPCTHCGQGTAWIATTVAGELRSLCARCAGAVARTGKLPEKAL